MHILLAAGSFILLPISVSGDRSRAGQFTHQPQILQCPMEQTDKWQVVCGRGACSSMSFLVWAWFGSTLYWFTHDLHSLKLLEIKNK